MVLSFWLLAAHFLRFGNTLFCLVLVSMPLLFLIKRKLVLYANQVFLCLGALFWVAVTYNMLNQRLMMGEDWTRLLFIMSGVVLFTLLSACCGLHHKVQNRYHCY
ncbi:hypothetical protein A3K86_01995 [Photobacterium jeanii]|uniref:Uncharacterized protein n=1 Tax=Photobacterium jeanii TaxID=858640 RepID=A0A178KL52_9GAMM|nr:hypothetical protein A3K86_01995 [Photobacterium jeanii]PST92624.1 hypothetical protein C9I91_05480 [Photobacterium jeanii]